MLCGGLAVALAALLCVLLAELSCWGTNSKAKTSTKKKRKWTQLGSRGLHSGPSAVGRVGLPLPKPAIIPASVCPNSSQTNGSSPLWVVLVGNPIHVLVPSELSAAFLQLAAGTRQCAPWGSPEIFRGGQMPTRPNPGMVSVRHSRLIGSRNSKTTRLGGTARRRDGVTAGELPSGAGIRHSRHWRSMRALHCEPNKGLRGRIWTRVDNARSPEGKGEGEGKGTA